MIGCFDDEKLGKVTAPTSQPHFVLKISNELEERGSEVLITFVAPDTWEIEADQKSYFPQHMVLKGDAGWEETLRGWTPFSRGEAVKNTLLASVRALAEWELNLRAAGSGPRYSDEKTHRFTAVTGEMDERLKRAQESAAVPAAVVATVNATYKDVVVHHELHVGTRSKLVYWWHVETKGPSIEGAITYTFDYTTPVSITVPR